MNITAAISLNQMTVPAVPSEAIVTHQGQDYIFIVENTLSFKKISIAKGTTDVGYTEITFLEEVPAHVKIVTKGAFLYWLR